MFRPAVVAFGLNAKFNTSLSPLCASLIRTATSAVTATVSTATVEPLARFFISAPALAPPPRTTEFRFAHLVISTAPSSALVIFKFSKFVSVSLFTVAFATAEVTAIVSLPAPPFMLWTFATLSTSTVSSPPPKVAVEFVTFFSLRLENPPSKALESKFVRAVCAERSMVKFFMPPSTLTLVSDVMLPTSRLPSLPALACKFSVFTLSAALEESLAVA